MNVLVTGGAGFIGSHLVKNHIAHDDMVWIIDNFTTGSDENLPKCLCNLADINHDYKGISKLKVDCIYHLGMPSSSPMYRENPCLVSKAIGESLKVLEYAKAHEVPVVFASTSSLYNGTKTPWKETSRILVTDYYTETRYAIERLFQLYDSLYGVKSVGLRLFSVYGPGEKAKGKYANLVTQFLLGMMENRNPILYYKGEQMRDFVYVDDVVRCFQMAMDKLLNSHPLPAVINVGTGCATSLNELVDLINAELRRAIQPSYLVPKDLRNYIESTLSDNSRRMACLDKEPFTALPEGIEKLIKFYHNNKSK